MRDTGLGIPTFASTTSLLEAVPHPYAVLDPQHVIRSVSAAYLTMTGASEADLVGRSIYDAFPDNPDDPSGAAEQLRASLDRVLATGEREALEFRHPIPIRAEPGRFTNQWWGVVNSAIRSGGGIVGVLHHSFNITERVLAERDAEIRERQMEEASSVASWAFVPTTGHAVVSAGVSRLFGLGDVSGPVDASRILDRYHPEDRERLLAQFAELEHARAGATISDEFRIVGEDGSDRWVRVHGELVRQDAHDPAKFVGISVDVTPAHERQAALEAALAERDRLLAQKEALLGEVNHRVKNSLQIVSSILNIDAASTEGAAAAERLRAAAARVRAVAAVHELIYKSGEVSAVYVDGYLRDLCRALEASADARVVVEAAPVRLSTDRAINVALLVNELVSNALEHGVAGRPDGRVEVRAARADGALTLSVADDGPGKPAGASPNLGARIIAVATRQLDARSEEGPGLGDDGAGHRVTVRIPLQD